MTDVICVPSSGVWRCRWDQLSADNVHALTPITTGWRRLLVPAKPRHESVFLLEALLGRSPRRSAEARASNPLCPSLPMRRQYRRRLTVDYIRYAVLSPPALSHPVKSTMSVW